MRHQHIFRGSAPHPRLVAGSLREASGAYVPVLMGVVAAARRASLRMAARADRTRTISLTLSFVTGYLEASSYASAQILCAHITGSLVLLLVRQPESGWQWRNGGVMLAFVCCVPLTGLLYRHWAKRKRGHAAVLALQTALVAVACVIGLLSELGASAAGRALGGCLLAAAMSAQNALHRLWPELGPSTTVMTANTAEFLLMCCDSARASSPPRELVRAVLARFVLGVCIGTAAHHRIGCSALWLPVLLLAALALHLWLHPVPDRPQRAP